MVEIVSSVREPTIQFYDNLFYLRNGLSNGEIQFKGYVHNYSPDAFVFNNKRRIYDFTRSAHATVRNDMTNYLCGLLQELPEEQCCEAFDYLFDYRHYKEYLTQVGDQKAESMKLLIFRHPDEVKKGYVAHVHFSSVARRETQTQFTVNATLTCQRYSYFELQEANLEELFAALQNLNLNAE